MTALLEDIEDAIAGQLLAVLPVGSRVLTPRQAYETTGAALNVLVAYRDSDYSRDLCFRKRTSRFIVQYDYPEEEMHVAMQVGMNGLDRYIPPLVDLPTDDLRIVSDMVERKDGTIYGVQIYELDIIG